MTKPFSPACERNQGPILDVLRERFADRERVLEIGSGTGQHAVHFARAMPHLVWQCSDVATNLGGIREWLNDARLFNTPPPFELDVDDDAREPSAGRFDAVFSANTLHIMGWLQVQRLFRLLPTLMAPRALLTLYGPFKEGGASSASNAAFDAALRAERPERGLRDLEAVEALAASIGLQRIDDRPMPANNRCLTWSLRPA